MVVLAALVGAMVKGTMAEGMVAGARLVAAVAHLGGVV